MFGGLQRASVSQTEWLWRWKVDASVKEPASFNPTSPSLKSSQYPNDKSSLTPTFPAELVYDIACW